MQIITNLIYIFIFQYKVILHNSEDFGIQIKLIHKNMPDSNK